VFDFFLKILDQSASYAKTDGLNKGIPFEAFAAKGLLVSDPHSPYYECRETNGAEFVVGRAFKSAKDKAMVVIHNVIDKGILVKELYR